MRAFPLLALGAIFVLSPFISPAQHEKPVISAEARQAYAEPIQPEKSVVLVQPISEIIGKTQNQERWNNSVRSLDKKHNVPDEIRAIKEAKTAQKRADSVQRGNAGETSANAAATPIVASDFEGNWYDGHRPPDNALAISNGGKIVSAVNSNIEYYDSDGTLLYTSSFADFFNDPTLTGTIYDPVILYDSGQDRFFMAVLHGSTSATSLVLVCFSQTNDPTDGWFVYQLTGNPLNDGSWFDYPKVGVSTNEVYVTGNLFDDNGNSQQAVIYQIEKDAGYLGNSLNWQYWHSLSDDPFTLAPAIYGHQGNYGPGAFFVSTDENGLLTDKIRLYDLTDDLSGSPSIDAYAVDTDFEVAGDALQSGSSVQLDNGDTRIMNAIYLNSTIHFVYHSDYANGYNGINYNRLDVSTLDLSTTQFGLDGYDYSYPAVASVSTTATDKSVMIAFLRSSSSIFPELRVVNCDDAGNWSGSVQVKAGNTYADNGQVSETRWGDYTGICRKQNSNPPEVWIGGQFGNERNLAPIGNTHCFETWIAEIQAGVDNTAIGDNPSQSSNGKAYPNPTYDQFNLEFIVPATTIIEVSIFDVNGQLVKLLYKDKAHAGRNLLSFNKGALSSGIYFVTINANNQTLTNEKLVIH